MRKKPDQNPLPDGGNGDQAEVIAFLGKAGAYGPDVTKVARIDTHAAIVFLAGDAAYKIKRAVRYPFLDYSTLARRRRFCEREVAINRRTAPALYLGVVPVVRSHDGRLTLGGEGEPVEWAVHMRRFDQAALFDRMAREDRLTAGQMVATADAVRAFHEGAECLFGDAAVGGGTRALQRAIAENVAGFDARPDFFPLGETQHLRQAMEGAFDAIGGLLDARVADGYVRHCHGDLHLGNLCLLDGRPTLFDAIEFNEAFAAIDVLDDLAFLLMDLDHRGMRPFANLVFNRYFAGTADFSGLKALPLFLASRASVRAKVNALAESSQSTPSKKAALREEALAYFSAARAYLAPGPARLVCIGGLSGTGKTRVARALAPGIGAVPGALHLRSDILRKQLFKAEEMQRLPQSAYGPEVSAKVYADLERRGASALGAGHSVIIDAVSARADERDALGRLAAGADFCGIWLEAPRETLAARVAARTRDASDATAAVVDQQLLIETGPISWHRLSTDRPLADVIDAARALL